MDTRLQLKITEEGKENKKTKHWAYAPHLSLSKSAWTPKVCSVLVYFNDFFKKFVSVGSNSCASQSGRLYKRWQVK